MLTKQFVQGLDPKRRSPGEAATERQPLALYFLGPEEDLKHVLAIWEAGIPAVSVICLPP